MARDNASLLLPTLVKEPRVSTPASGKNTSTKDMIGCVPTRKTNGFSAFTKDVHGLSFYEFGYSDDRRRQMWISSAGIFTIFEMIL